MRDQSSMTGDWVLGVGEQVCLTKLDVDDGFQKWYGWSERWNANGVCTCNDRDMLCNADAS